MPALPVPARQQLPVALDGIAQAAAEFARASAAQNTLRAYAADWRAFETWCQGAGLVALPAAPQTVGLYLTAAVTAGAKPATLERRIVAIARAHRLAGAPLDTRHPAIRDVRAGIRRTVGTAQAAKPALWARDLRRILEGLGDTLRDVRDRALLLLGFAGGFRRSELVGLDWLAAGTGTGTVTVTPEGLVVRLTRSKTDQEGAGRIVGVPYAADPALCPVRAVQAWAAAAGLVEGAALFTAVDRHGRTGTARSGRTGAQPRLSAQSVALVIKQRAEAAGLAGAADYAGHSLRAGLATSAAAGGASERSIMAQTGHRSTKMVRRYIRDGRLFADNAAAAAFSQA